MEEKNHKNCPTKCGSVENPHFPAQVKQLSQPREKGQVRKRHLKGSTLVLSEEEGCDHSDQSGAATLVNKARNTKT